VKHYFEAALDAEDAEEVGLGGLQLYGEGGLVPVGQVLLQGHHHTRGCNNSLLHFKGKSPEMFALIVT